MNLEKALSLNRWLLNVKKPPTFFQLKALHKLDADSQEIQNYKVTLHNNTVTSMQVFVEAAEKFGYKFDDADKVFRFIFSTF